MEADTLDDILQISLDQTTQTPLYKQIVDQVRQHIATGVLQPGEHLPTVRQLAQSLNINPGTVVRAYLELEQDGVIVSRRGGGTIVSAASNDPQLLLRRQKQLDNIVSETMLEIFSMGYSPVELETSFRLHLARWHEERKGNTTAVSDFNVIKREEQNKIHVVGSHDIALNLLVDQLKYKRPEIQIEMTNSGSLGGLIALQEERADIAGIHLLDEETMEYNYPYVKRILTGKSIALVHLSYRMQGLMFAKNNPKNIEKIEDVCRQDVVFINRQKGSGTRVLLDFELRRHGILPARINGYTHEANTHLEVAIDIARGNADVGLGIEGAARSCEIEFVPLFRERYDLVMTVEKYHTPVIKSLLEIITNEEFKKLVAGIGGYDISQTGNTVLYDL
jgi:molybdate-binding protein/DNA-binding transcriptional regulator YhcF (GntR family)